MFATSLPTWRLRPASSRLAKFGALCVVALAIQPSPARGGQPDTAGVPVLTAIDEVGSGNLLFRTNYPGRFVPAPLLATEVDIRISGMVARVRLRQQFHNPTGSWLEGVYVFPLPENAAVDRMRLSIGDRVIEANIKERKAARRTYEKAKSQGRHAALIEQHRPNIFTNAVANIGPREMVTVELRYQHTLRYDQGQFRLRFPMVVAPRYIPGPVTVARAENSGWASVVRAAEDAEHITAPVLDPKDGRVNPVTLRIALDAGFPLADLKSSFHDISASDWRGGKASITLGDGAVPADRDFELVWVPQTGTAPVAGLFRETVGGDTYLLVMVLPPDQDRDAAPPTPRDAVFVIDRSGSMAGTSIIQAKRALVTALDRLRPNDRFDIISFANSHDSLFGGLRPADVPNIGRAKSLVRSTRAGGGTVMLPALRRALSGGRDAGRLRQVVFITDGAVGNEAHLLREIESRLNGSRLFTIGIGSAPNSYFMRKAAEAGRGSFTHIGKLSQVASRLDGLFRKLERSALTDVATRWSSAAGEDLSVDAYPKLVPDLYHGEPLMLTARLSDTAAPDPGAALHITGVRGGRQWRHVLLLAGARPAQGIAALWGRARITDLMDSLRRGAKPDEVRKAVIKTALRHSLVSRYTSLVAVSKLRARPDAAPLAEGKVPLNLPAGWVYDKVFGPSLKKLSPARMKEAMLRPAGGAAGTIPVMLPQGASPAPLNIVTGILALLAAGGMVLWRRRTA